MAFQLIRDLGEVKHTATTTLTMGTPVLLNTLVLVPMTNAVANELVTLKYQGVFSVVKVAGTTKFAWAIGKKLYWDAGASGFSTVATSNTFAGRADATAAKAAVAGVIHLGAV